MVWEKVAVKRTIFIWGCLLFCSLVALGEEFRGIWVDSFGPGFKTKTEVKQLVEDCRKHNFNAVIVQVRKRGDSYYIPHAPSDEPRGAEVAEGFDPLAEVIRQCHNGSPRIEVHAWVVAYFVWSYYKPPPQPNHVFNRHPDWFTKDSSGQQVIAKGYYLDPGNPEANEYVLNIAKDIVTHYDVDGLHWDYFRYPDQTSGYNETALQRYKEEFQTSENPKPDDPRFGDWRRRQVTDFLRWSTADLLEIKPKLIVSASVFSNYKDSKEYRFADWAAWNNEGIIDVCVPMDFTKDSRFIFNPRADVALTNQWNRMVYVGQGAYMNTKENTLTQLEYCREKGFKGTVYYSYRNPDLSGETESTASPTPPQEAISTRDEIIVDNHDAEMAGPWKSGRFGKFVAEDYLFIENGTGSNFVSFHPQLPQSGEYDIYEWHVAGTNRCTRTPCSIIAGNRTNRVTINQRQDGARWNLLGRYQFETNALVEVRITDGFKEDDAVAIADAIKFVKAQGEASPIGETESEEKARKVAEAERNRVAIFEFVKEKHQPDWENAPSLKWKAEPVTGIIKGTVLDKKTGRPLYNALVTLNTNPARKQRTEPHGNFAFFDAPPGENEITTDSGAKSSKTKIEIKSGKVQNFDIFISY
jgi:uncharacterized lipoprotein YddW (UPF0748 family)